MQFTTLSIIAFLATVVAAMPNKVEARADCSNFVPACFGGSIAGQTNCRCEGQVEKCDLWICPGPSPNTVSTPPIASLVSFVRYNHNMYLVLSLSLLDGE